MDEIHTITHQCYIFLSLKSAVTLFHDNERSILAALNMAPGKLRSNQLFFFHFQSRVDPSRFTCKQKSSFPALKMNGKTKRDF